MSLDPSNPDGMLGRLVYITRPKQVDALHDKATRTVSLRERVPNTRLPGIGWRIVELDKQRDTLVLRSTMHGTRSECSLDWFMRQVWKGQLEVE